MGCCYFPSATKPSRQPTAKVIGPDGSLSEHPIPITVAKVLGIDRLSCFLCNCDSIQVDDCLSPLDLSEHLYADRIYFVVPKAKLKHRLTGADMAALAVKATKALSVSSSANDESTKKTIKKRKHLNGGYKNSKADDDDDDDDVDVVGTLEMPSSTSKKKVISRSLSSGLAKAVRRSFRRVLSTIDESNE